MSYYMVKIRDGFCIDRPLEKRNSYTMAFKGEVVAKNENVKDNITTFYLQPTGENVIANEAGERITTKDKQRNSVKLRNAIFAIWSLGNKEYDFEDFYTWAVTKRIMPALDRLLGAK